MSGQDQGQDVVAEPRRQPLTAEQARAVTAGLLEAMEDVRRTVAVLAARVRDAHTARVWVPLGEGSWESYCATELGISLLSDAEDEHEGDVLVVDGAG
ncbi:MULTISPECIES: hypothetical protein [unclassified Streptomyces]|uniref:hypothetical protein n=1 Tax=unclassified Streptomyces TaxID=2593676 RepID=UPI0019550750|nr:MULTISPECIES: hypothetical protein [unclassified Streptomyces]